MKIYPILLSLIVLIGPATVAVADEGYSTQNSLPDYQDIPICPSGNESFVSITNPESSSGETICIGDTLYLSYQSSGNWSGYVVKDNFYDIVEVKGLFTTPPVNNTCANSYWAPWVGLGGFSSQSLIQMGIQPINLGTSNQKYVLWIEYLNAEHQNPPIYITSRIYNPGVSLLLSVTYNLSTHKVVFYADDSSSSTPFVDITSSDLSSYFDGSNAEWISEKPNPNAPIYDFGNMTFSDNQVKLSNGYWKAMGEEPGLVILLKNDSGVTLAAPITSTIFPTQFTNHFYRCQ
jgi:hypothetical protein